MTDQAFIVPPKSREEIRQLSKVVRAIEGTPRGRFDIIHFIESTLPQIDKKFELIIEDKSSFGEVLGLTYPDSKTIILREDIYENACEGDGFARMTVAHELGHFMLHSTHGIGFARCFADINTVRYMNSEWQANCFAGELLIPWDEKDRIQDLGALFIADEYGVSISAAEFFYKLIWGKDAPACYFV